MALERVASAKSPAAKNAEISIQCRWIGSNQVSIAAVLLYPIVDADACAARGIAPAKLANWLHAAGVKQLQLRAKSWDFERLLELACEVRRTVPPEQCRLFVNDHVDVATRSGCFGVHVGQTDLSVSEVRALAPQVAVGVSTHSLDQVNEALRAHPDYIAIGPVFPTASKRDPEPTVGVEGLRAGFEVCKLEGVPVVAIGGITPSNVHLVRPYCSYVAVIGAVTYDDEQRVRDAVHAFRNEA